jgi:type VI secretion system secreted protein VgrG
MTATAVFGGEQQAPFELRAGAKGELTLAVASVRGTEALSHLYRFDVTVVASLDADELRRSVLGQAAELSLRSPSLNDPRRVRGMLCRLTELGTRDPHGRAGFVLRLVPRAWFLGRRRTSRIFQEMSVVDVVDRVLDEHRVQRLWKTTRAYPKRDYCVQYQESDLEFVKRLLAENGLFFRFEEHERITDSLDTPWDQAEEVLVIGDGVEAYGAITPSGGAAHRLTEAPALPFERMTGGLGQEHVSSLTRSTSVAIHAVRQHDYDFQRPLLDLSTSSTPLPGASAFRAPSDPTLEWYEHHGDHSNVDESRDRAEIRLSQLRRRALLARGEATCRRLAPGRAFRLEGHPEPGLDGTHVVVKVRHRGANPGLQGTEATSSVYQCQFECVPAGVAHRPPAPQRRRVEAVESAVVVGPSDETVFTDEYGRIQIQFHWDREGRREGRSSCWVRVAQPWAGSGYGMQLIPRVGNEVLVNFLGGDPDRPVVMGSVHNRVQMPPFPLPAGRTRSGIRTSSAAGGNELSFEDEAGNEQVRLFACRDLEEEVARHATRTVRGNDKSVVEGSRHVTVSGGRHGVVRGDAGDAVGGNRSVDVQGDDDLAVGGNLRTRCDGDVELAATGDAKHTVGGATVARFEGAVRIDAAGDVATHIEGHHQLTVGVDGTGNSSSTFVFGNLNLSATGDVAIRAEEEISLTCGGTSLRLTPDGLVALGRALRLAGAADTLITGGKSSQHLHDDVEVVAEQVSVFSKGASLELTDTEARLGGSKVKLGHPASGQRVGVNEPSKPDTKRVRWRLADVAFAPYAHKHYHLLTCGLRLEGDTDGDGYLTADLPKEARSAAVILWVGDYPTGERRKYTVVIADELPDPTTAAGARARLHALGYDVGLQGGDPWVATRDAVRQFQVDHAETHALQTTGELDDATKQAIARVFGG